MSAGVLSYLDPGSGSVLVQVVLGGVAGVAVAFKLLRHRVARLFKRGGSEGVTSAAEEQLRP